MADSKAPSKGTVWLWIGIVGVILLIIGIIVAFVGKGSTKTIGYIVIAIGVIVALLGFILYFNRRGKYNKYNEAMKNAATVKPVAKTVSSAPVSSAPVASVSMASTVPVGNTIPITIDPTSTI